MPGFHNHYTCMPGVNSYSMPGLANCDTGHKALCPVSLLLVLELGRRAFLPALNF